jgi:hypothetical protein
MLSAALKRGASVPSLPSSFLSSPGGALSLSANDLAADFEESLIFDEDDDGSTQPRCARRAHARPGVRCVLGGGRGRTHVGASRGRRSAAVGTALSTVPGHNCALLPLTWDLHAPAGECHVPGAPSTHTLNPTPPQSPPMHTAPQRPPPAAPPRPVSRGPPQPAPPPRPALARALWRGRCPRPRPVEARAWPAPCLRPRSAWRAQCRGQSAACGACTRRQRMTARRALCRPTWLHP